MSSGSAQARDVESGVSSAPRIGRYAVVGELAVGGMAQILLASLSGPSGFRRPVVLKRILPQLAHQESFVGMFLEEARIAASIRHPNVVHVEELASDDNGPFLAMEYLEGESLACLERRLASRTDTLPAWLGAHIVAEACAGLHAAHELTAPDGTPLNLVHRDVSPQNVLITYEGHVKVLDFGVARVDDRANVTKTGELKGKFQYMSPEQCKSKPLDRRSDVFALGTVLYEVTTGCRLFARDSALETMQAITEEMVVPPTRVHFDYPAELEAICLRALAHAPADRFATTADMRRELARFVAKHASGDPTEALAAEMRRAFADRIAEKRELLRKVQAGNAVAQLPSGETDDAVELPTVAQTLATVTRAKPAGDRPRKRPWIAAAMGVAAAALAFAAVRATVHHDAADLATPSPSPSAAALQPLARPSASAVTSSSAPVETGAGSAAVAASVATSTSAPSTSPSSIALELRTQPSGATVMIAGKRAGTTPLTLPLDASDAPVTVELSLAGHVPTRRQITPNRDQLVEVSLERAKRTTTRRGTGKPSGSAAPSQDFDRFE